MPTNPALWDPTKDPNDPYYGFSDGTQAPSVATDIAAQEKQAPNLAARGGWSQTPLVNTSGVQVAGNPQPNYPQSYITPTPLTQPQQTLKDYQDWADLFQSQGNESLTQNVTPYQTALNQGYQQDAATRNAILGNYGGALNAATAANAGMYQGMDAARQGIDSNSNQILGDYWGQLGQANGMDAANVGQLNALNGQMRQLQAGGYGADVTSDPAYVGMQLGAYNNFGNWASGANNISSDAGLVGQQQGVANQFGGWASGANDISSDAGLVAQQQGVFGAYGDWASGANDVYSDAALVGQQQNVLSGYGDWASGANDLTSEAALAQADAESLSAQKDALGQFKERSDPRLTDAERFLYLQNRLQQEQTMRGVRDANMRELQRQGMSGSTMALSNLNSSSQEAANMRQLGDLGANAAAIKRADANLGNYANLSSTIADQSFNRDFATRSSADRMAVQNNQQRFAGLQGEGQMSTVMRNADDNLRVNNQQARFQGLQGQGVQANTMRSQDDAIRGQNQSMRFSGLQGQGSMVNNMRSADDSMRQFNSGQMLQGAVAQGGMASDMRNADDALRTFNKAQSLQQQRFQDSFAADQQNQAWNRGVDVSNAGFKQSTNLANNATTGWQAGNATLNGQWDRYGQQVNTGVGMNRDYVSGQGQAGALGMDAINGNRASVAQDAQFALGRTGQQLGINNAANALKGQAITEAGESSRAASASRDADRREKQRQEFELNNRGLLDYLGL